MNHELQSIKQRFGIIGNAPKLNHAIQIAAQVAPTDMTVLISGESGSGKESFSKIIHQLSHRKHGQFIAVNCGAIPEGTIDSELFGHEKGSFTGAHEARKGYFEVTNGGTIFLDEIGEMPLGTQARLLRVLENGEFIKVGSSKVQKTDVRVVAATNVNLLDAVEKGRFREDLYYRLNTVPIYVPALRERGTDVVMLFKKFASDFSEKYRVKPLKLEEEAEQKLISYRFPGNIRQLKNLVEQMSVLEMDRDVSLEALVKYLPADRVETPTLFGSTEKMAGGFTERDILYKVLFDLKKDVTELKKLVFNLLTDSREGKSIINDHPQLFNFTNAEAGEKQEETRLIIAKSEPKMSDDYDYHQHVEDITHAIAIEDEDESLSLEKKEKEMIVLALKKNNNKRKYAASDLGISERTLYRKIKQYDIKE
jgi:transcriptional regulator with PAS, ATPase and Fis domain